MALTLDKLTNDERFSGDNVLHFLLYLPLGLILMSTRVILGLVLWIAAIILPNKSAVRQILSTLACWTFGVYVELNGGRDPRCSVLVANYVSCLDSLAATYTMGSISLRKWKVPPFFASTLGIKNTAQFVRKEHFTEIPIKPVLLQPEGGPTNGKGLLKFTDWSIPIGNRVQPLAITVERVFTNVTVHRPNDKSDVFPWWDALWFLWTPCSIFTLKLLPAVDRMEDSDQVFAERVRQALADALQIEVTEYTWEELNRGPRVRRRAAIQSEVMRRARHVKEVLPLVPLKDIVKELEKTRSVDVTITNFLEGLVPYTPEVESVAEPQPSTSQAPPKYVTPLPTGTFPKSAKERQMSFQDRKAQMIAEARQRYIEKHKLQIAC
ncbi:lipid droplet-regulating VLDL assembly factor AUP1-like [Maniola jurtina]|uniref:lipid droplet-regulating VLDL assembly factor AUP1-like n=1 Tax=Maniola jurtina TaxID=191418 RepID=UPI001E68CA6F|nr:lipid droplet-regulating VLDL assembly factor AUP1-like [Maniola jurtina]XP_045766509.1 lipid droplet-regulating VLDL assembly factor AUP1-like [Maniola jurtina]